MTIAQTMGMEAFLSFVLALTVSSLVSRRKGASLETGVAIGAVLLLGALLGRPILFAIEATARQGIWIHLVGLVSGAVLARLIYRYLAIGAKNIASDENGIYEALRVINQSEDNTGDRH